jgi:hypothetical protein
MPEIIVNENQDTMSSLTPQLSPLKIEGVRGCIKNMFSLMNQQEVKHGAGRRV